MTPHEIAILVVDRLAEAYPDPLPAWEFPVGFSRSGAYCIAGSIIDACGMGNMQRGASQFPGRLTFRRFLIELGLPKDAAFTTTCAVQDANDRRDYPAAYEALAAGLAQADPEKLRAIIPHSLWPPVMLDEVIAATEAARQRQEVVETVLLREAVVLARR